MISFQKDDFEENLDDIFKEIAPLVESALNLMEEMRICEGEKLKEDILVKLDTIEQYVDEIEKVSEAVPKMYKKKLEERLNELLSGVDIDESRVALEVAIFSDKAAVDEEITRLNSHVFQFKDLIKEDVVGKKLDFLIQEMNRETNTIGSKANNLEIVNRVVDIKTILEDIREQIQNIE